MLEDHISLSNGDIQVWVEQGHSLCIKAVTKKGDPVELSEDEARQLAKELERLADLAESGQ